jgi:cytochrome c-type biogenesis protein CcmH
MRSRLLHWLNVLLLAQSFALAGAVLAAEATPTEQDPVAQARAVNLEEQLRCLVCQNQTIAESNADLAVDLRRQVREQIAAGRTDAEIIDYMTARYGDFVLYRPPFKAVTVLLWAGPALLLALGAWMLTRIVRERRVAEAPPLTPEERARAEALLADANGSDKP